MKKLIVAAVAAAVIAPAAVMAAGPTLYGHLHMSVDGKDNGGSGSDNTKYNEWGLNSNSSRIGVKGSEDLGNGMKVGYLIEWNVFMDESHGDSELTSRNHGLTLSGDWGTALVGKWDTPMKSVGRKFDLFGDKVGDTRNLSGSGTLENRADNVVAYVTPNMNGFSATAAYVFDSGNCNNGAINCSGDNSDSNAYSFNAIYNNGPILVALGYVDYSADGQTFASADDSSSWRVGGSYAFGDFKVLGSYTDIESEGLVKNADTDIWTVGGSYKMGNNTIKLQYAERDDLDHTDETGSDQWSIGLDHAMSKRTQVYAAYAAVSNDDNSARKSWGGKNSGHDGEGAAAVGEDNDVFSVGIVHKF